MPDKPTDGGKAPDFPDDEEIRNQLKALGFDDEEDDRDLQLGPPDDKTPLDDQQPPARLKTPEMPNTDEIDQQLRRFSDKVASTGGTRMPNPPDWNYKRSSSGRPHDSDPNNYRGLGVGISAAYFLVGAMAAGFGIGWLIDKSIGASQTGTAIGGLLGCVVGIAGVVWMINRGNR
jgi:hypothetical protein